MRLLNGGRTMAMAGVLLILPAITLAAEARTSPADSTADGPRECSVAKTFDNSPFDYRMELRSEGRGYRVYRLTYPSPVTTPVKQNNTIPADYYLPDGIEPDQPKRPAVICLHILNGNYELVNLTCSVLASRGIPALMFKLPYYGERSLPEGQEALASNPELFVGALAQAFQDVRRTVDVLASRPEVDPERIGITGISLGAIVAATAAGQEPRLSRVVLLLAGGDLSHIIHHAQETKELSEIIENFSAQEKTRIERSIDAVDPLRHAAGLRRRAKQGKVLMINATEDEVVPRPCTEKLAAALGIEDQVIWYEGLGHYTAMAVLPEALQTTADFFANDLPEEVRTKPAAAAERSALGTVALLMQQVGASLFSDPSPGHCHFVDLEVAVTLKDGRQHDGWLRLIRGAQQRFNLQCKLPIVGEAALGQGAHPWMASGEKIVFKGAMEGDAQPGNPLAFAEEQHVMKLRMFSGLLTAMALVPDTLQRWVEVEEDKGAEGTPAVKVVRKDSEQDNLRIVFKKDGKTPQSMTFSVEGARGTVTFRAWRFNTLAHDALFEAPDKLPAQEVDPVDLYRMFSAMFNFAMESIE